ncbi:MAG: DUF3987 domain-containing protein [Planctomycetota bacterium]
MDAIKTIIDRLSGVRRIGENQYVACCPAHDDKHASLSIGVGNDGRVLLRCHAGCSTESIVDALGLKMSDLFVDCSSNVPPPPSTPKSRLSALTNEEVAELPAINITRPVPPAVPPPPPKTLNSIVRLDASRHGDEVGRWTYVGTDNDPVGVVVRFNTSTGKTFRPYRRTKYGWERGDPAGKWPIYRLYEVIEADRVFIVEGEKACDTATELGFTCTTSAHGSSSAGKTDWSPLAGKEVVILPDNDSAGEKYAEDVANRLVGQGCVVRIVYLPDLPEHGDLVEFVTSCRDAGLSDSAIRCEVERLTEVEPYQPARPESGVPKYQPFPIETLPGPLATFVRRGAKAIGCDPSYIALPMLSSLAAAVGNSRRIELKPGWVEPAILWTAIVGESGSKKSPPLDLALAPVRKRQRSAMADFRAALSDYDAERLVYEKHLASWRRGKDKDENPPNPPDEPRPERLVIADTTVEALASNLANQPRGLLLARDELSGLFGSFDRYSGGRGADAANYLEFYRGQSLSVDRKGGSPPLIYVPRASVSITGTIQPGILRTVLGKQHRESGMAARFLFAYPPRIPTRWTDEQIDPVLESQVANLVGRLYELPLHIGEDGEAYPVNLSLTSEAKDAFVAFYNAHGSEQDELAGDTAAAFSKLSGCAARLALVIHCCQWAAGSTPQRHDEQIDVCSMEAGITLARWFANEALRIYAMLDESEQDRTQRDLIDWIAGRGGCVTVREIQRGPRRFRQDTTSLEKSLDELVSEDFGRWQACPVGERGGRPSRQFILNS